LWAISPQWWITGFNPEFNDPNVKDMVSLDTIDFTGREDMYDALKDNMENNSRNKYLIFDEDGHTVWVIWYEGINV